MTASAAWSSDQAAHAAPCTERKPTGLPWEGEPSPDPRQELSGTRRSRKLKIPADDRLQVVHMFPSKTGQLGLGVDQRDPVEFRSPTLFSLRGHQSRKSLMQEFGR